MKSFIWLLIFLVGFTCGEVGQGASGDGAAPAVKTLPLVFEGRRSFYASMKENLGKADVKVENLKARYGANPSNRDPNTDRELTSIEAELKGLHDVVNNLSTVKDDDLQPLETKVTRRFSNVERDLKNLENHMN